MIGVWWIRGVAHAEMARLSIASFRKAYPDGEVIVYTEEGDPASTVPLDAMRVRLPGGRPAMVANLDAQVHAMTRISRHDEVVFLDADTLVRKPYSLPESADLGATWRDHVGLDDQGQKIAGIAKAMPYNYGVLYARAEPATVEAFLWLRARILRMSRNAQDWYGNQMALAELLGAPAEGLHSAPIPWTLEDPGYTTLRFLCLPCEQHNYTPEAAGEPVEDKFVLHFKGGRKDMMEAYA